MHFRPAFRTETYQFEYIAQRNNIKTSYYVQRMMEHYFPLKLQKKIKHNYEFSPKKQPRGIYGQVPEK